MEKEQYQFDIYRDGMLNPKIDYFFLNHFQSFQEDVKKKEQICFLYQDPTFSKWKYLKERYHLEQVAGEGSDDEKRRNLTKWVAKNLHFGQNIDKTISLNSEYILHHSLNGHMQSNCRMAAIVLNEIFLSFGFFSRKISCLSMDLRDEECHCVTVAYSNQLSKWVIYDASLGILYLDINGIPLSLEELRNKLLHQEDIIIPGIPRIYKRRILNYWLKNLIRFQCTLVSAFDIETKNHDIMFIHLNPVNYNTGDVKVKLDNYNFDFKETHDSNLFWQKPRISSYVGGGIN